MSSSPMQLPLGIGLRDSATFSNFLPGPNAAALQSVQSGMELFLYLWAASGNGKSHLLQAACHARANEGAVYLPLDELLDYGPEVLEGQEAMALVCIDELQAVAGDRAWEEALFHLYNRVRDAGHRLMAVGDAPPRELGIELPDLVSRIAWGPVFQLQPLSDADKASAMQMRAQARGLELPDEVAGYLLRHAPRGLHGLFELLERLDHASLVAQRRLTIPFVRQYL